MQRALSLYRTQYDKAPYLTAYLTCSFKGLLATGIALSQEKREDFDAEKTLRRFVNYSLVFGGLYCGCAQHFLYNSLYARLYGASVSLRTASAKIATECFVANPFVAMPLYYVCKGMVEEKQGPTAGLLQYQNDFRQVFVEYCMCWGPAHAITFGVVPPQVRHCARMRAKGC